MGAVPISMLRAFSEPRLRVYITAAQGDTTLAERLYWWNIEISAAFYGPLHCLELGLRNALDYQLRGAFAQDTWWDVAPLNRVGRENVTNAVNKCKLRGAGMFTADDVVAELSLGFWTSLLSNPKGSGYDRRLWVPILHRAFPHYRKQRDRLHQKFETMRLLRNRIMHHEPIHHRDLSADHRKIFELLGYIDPAIERQASLLDRVPAVLRTRQAVCDGTRPPSF